MIGSETVTLISYGDDEEDRYGDLVPVETDRTDIDRCAVAPRSSPELTDRGRQGVIVGLTIYMPSGTDVTHRDRFLVGGVEYEVDGEAGTWK